MADKKISALTAAALPLAGTEVLPIVQSGATVKVASNDLTVRNVRANATTGILQVTGPAAAATRVMTVPDANFSAARIDAAQTFTGNQTFSGALVQTGTANAITADFSSHQTSMNNGDTLTITGLINGFIEIAELAFGGCGLILVGSGATTIVSQSSTLRFSTIAGTPGSVAVYVSGSNVIIQSNNAAALVVSTNIRKLG
jgi:hypothetical protein